MENKVKMFFKQNIGYFIIAFVSLVYIATGILTVEETGKTILQIIADSVIILFLGVFINRVFDLQGILNGNREKEVVDTEKAHSDMVIKISPHIERLDPWCKIKNEQALKIARIKILSPSGLKYEKCFDEAGVGLGYTPDISKKDDKIEWKKEKLKLRLYNKALNVKITNLNSNILTSEGGREGDPNYLGRSKAQYETKSSIIDIVSRIGIAIIFGYFGVDLIKDFNFINLIWQLFQVSLFLVMGIVKLYQSFIFIKDEFRARIQKKTNILREFSNFVTANPSPAEAEILVTIKPTEEIVEENAEEIPEENLNKGDLKNDNAE